MSGIPETYPVPGYYIMKGIIADTVVTGVPSFITSSRMGPLSRYGVGLNALAAHPRPAHSKNSVMVWVNFVFWGGQIENFDRFFFSQHATGTDQPPGGAVR